jgi:hypothetical protein
LARCTARSRLGAPRYSDDVHQRSAIQEDAVREFLHFGVDFFDQLLAVDGGAQQGSVWEEESAHLAG